MTHFCQRSVDFLYFNHKHNSKSWYAEHRDDYKEYLLLPFQDLATALAPTMLSIDEQFIVSPNVGGTISRIYKDLRFAKDKTSLYRDAMWLTFMRDKNCDHALPGYFFELSPYMFRYGCGYYFADSAAMKSARKLILENSPSFQDAKNCYENQNIFKIYGECYKQSHYPDQPESLKTWLDRKYIGFIAECKDIDQLCSTSLPDMLSQRFLSIKPIYDFMMTAESLAER